MVQFVQFVDKREASRLTGLSGDTLKKYRLKQGLLIEGIHWVRLNAKTIRYNLPLVQDWLQNRNDPKAHQRAVENYQATLLSNQPKKPGRPSLTAVSQTSAKEGK